MPARKRTCEGGASFDGCSTVRQTRSGEAGMSSDVVTVNNSAGGCKALSTVAPKGVNPMISRNVTGLWEDDLRCNRYAAPPPHIASGIAIGSAMIRQTAPSIANAMSRPPSNAMAPAETPIACEPVTGSSSPRTNAATNPTKNGTAINSATP